MLLFYGRSNPVAFFVTSDNLPKLSTDGFMMMIHPAIISLAIASFKIHECFVVLNLICKIK